MTDTVLIAMISLCGTCFGSIAGVLTANRLTLYRIGELEKKVEQHNQLQDRVIILEEAKKDHERRIGDLEDEQ